MCVGVLYASKPAKRVGVWHSNISCKTLLLKNFFFNGNPGTSSRESNESSVDNDRRSYLTLFLVIPYSCQVASASMVQIIPFSPLVHTLGVTLDPTLTFRQHI